MREGAGTDRGVDGFEKLTPSPDHGFGISQVSQPLTVSTASSSRSPAYADNLTTHTIV